MKKFLFCLNLLLGCLFAMAQTVPAPTVGDFQSRQNGSWTSIASWSVYTASGWVNATTYPGASTGTYKTFVRPDHTLDITTNITFNSGDIYILSSVTDNATGNFLRYPQPSDFSAPVSGTTVKIGRVNINTSTVNLFGPTQSLFIFGGTLYFDPNNAHLTLYTGNSLVVTNYSSGYGPNVPFGTNGVQPVTAQDCTGQKRINFRNPTTGANEYEYAICYANSGQYTFHGLNSMGGSLQTILAASVPTLCSGQVVQLTGSSQGLNSGNLQYRWSVSSQPVGSTVTFPTTYQSGPATGQTVSTNLTLVTPGTYVFGLEIRYLHSGTSNYVSSLETVIVVVNPLTSSACGCYKNPVLSSNPSTTIAPIPSKMGISSYGKDGVSSQEWLSSRKGAALILESKSGGMVINRVDNVTSIPNPVEGMIVYDTTENCLKIATKESASSAATWKCIQKPSCPTL